MSTSYSAALVYGLPYNQAVNLTSNKFIDALIDKGDLEIFTPHYYAPREDSIVGVAIVQTGSYSFTLADATALGESKLEHMDKEGKRLEKLFGAENLKLYLTTVGS